METVQTFDCHIFNQCKSLWMILFNQALSLRLYNYHSFSFFQTYTNKFLMGKSNLTNHNVNTWQSQNNIKYKEKIIIKTKNKSYKPIIQIIKTFVQIFVVTVWELIYRQSADSTGSQTAVWIRPREEKIKKEKSLFHQ